MLRLLLKNRWTFGFFGGSAVVLFLLPEVFLLNRTYDNIWIAASIRFISGFLFFGFLLPLFLKKEWNKR